ncbi:TraR/DksA family transcriptional regulator [Photobacterium atrarenae]|uniref:Conjugal transfer protein TraR n=1 Tax=Photobacterium atrarenae TaxID=865757 RepID=A0ABY5GHR8_9GAMM|nr:conjugal transfer protein TraR [Photobacterium atrarenae]UTV28473.1 conjugal transfer protein TraR [Photobacterium atrarenae]
MTTSERAYQQLKRRLEQEHEALLNELKHELVLNTLVPSTTAIELADLNALIKIAGASYLGNLHDLAARLEVVDAAICAMKLGMYGLCTDCEETIELAALEADPAQPRCHACRSHSRYHHD